MVNLSGAALLGGVTGAAISGNALVLADGRAGLLHHPLDVDAGTHRLGQDDRPALAVANLVGPLLAGFGALGLGHAIGAAV